MVHFIDDSSSDAWFASIKEHPTLGREYRLMMQLLEVLLPTSSNKHGRRSRFGMAYQEVYGPSEYAAEVIHRRFKQCAARIRTEDERIVKEFFYPYEADLHAESRVRNTYDPESLLGYCNLGASDGLIDMQARVEAVARFITSRLLLYADLHESEVDVGEQEGVILAQLLPRLFVQECSLETFLDLSLDRRAKWRIKDWSIDGRRLDGRIRLQERFLCRAFEIDGVNHPVYIEDRVKSDFSSILKMLRKNQDMGKENDKRGVRMIVFSQKAFNEFVKALRSELSRGRFQVIEESENISTAGKVDSNNPVSKEDFRVHRFVAEYADPGHSKYRVEVNVQFVDDYLNDRWSLSPARHELYRFEQLQRYFCPFRYPRFIHGIDWTPGSQFDQRMRTFMDYRRRAKVLARSAR
ncbi:hypothetical protein KBC55_00440 [Patescibacteria group bacterium]|nr:hypothetical protein [Patescibacteria group bacterium]